MICTKAYVLIALMALINATSSWKLNGKALLNPEIITEQFSLGQHVSGDIPIYFDQKDFGADGTGSINAEVIYPESHDGDDSTINAYIITRVEVYLQGSAGFESQVYVLQGGIQHSSIILDINASNTNYLHYAVMIYGIGA